MIDRKAMMGSRQLAGTVARWHTWPTLRPQTVAAHSARVATIYCELWGIPRGEVLYYCLHHDSGEFTAGDVPFGAKRLSHHYKTGSNEVEHLGLATLGVKMPALTELEFTQFKVADILEMWEFGSVERDMGNKYAETVINDTIEAAMKLASTINATHTIIKWSNGGLRNDNC